MNIFVNGSTTDIGEGATVADVLESVAPEAGGRGVAVAVNGEVITRAEWGRRNLAERDQVEILRAVGGG